ncbi:MAG: stalk domain-containing protein [Syntrophomonadaceae bacterium]|jgi:hypothetical protein
MLRRNRTLSIVMTLCLCLALLAPVFVAPPVAEAAATYKAVTCPNVGANETNIPLGIIEINVDNSVAVKTYDVITINLPSGVSIATAAGTVQVNNAAADVNVSVPISLPSTAAVPNALAGTVGTPTVASNGKSINIPFAADGIVGQGLIYVYLNKVNTSGASGDLNATISGSNQGVFSTDTVRIGKAGTAGGTTVSVQGTKTLSVNGGDTDIISVIETRNNTFDAGDVISLKLPSGFSWGSNVVTGTPTVTGNWSFQGITGLSVNNGVADPRVLKITLPTPLPAGFTTRTSAARIDIVGNIKIDDTIAKKGDITVTVSGDNITDTDLVVGSYVDYNASVIEDVVKEVVAGWDSTELGSFRIKEDLADSLIPGRTISFTLPAGVKWNTNATAAPPALANWPDLSTAAANPLTIETESGSLNLGNTSGISSSNNGRTIRVNVPAGSHTKSTILFKKPQVTISPDFVGDLEIEVGGTAGVTGTVKVAEVLAPVTMTTDGDADIVIGSQGQAAGDIVITESKKEVLKANNNLVLALPTGATWSAKPIVEVTEGDLVLDTISTNGGTLTIAIKSASSTPSTIEISDVKVTTDRTVPEGNFKVRITGASTALSDNAVAAKFDTSTIVSTVIGQCVTPAPGQGTAGAAAGQFRIGSNIYEVDGVAKVMDVAPYIKNDRTYVPVRYMGYALGVAEEDVVWDEATQKVTLTKGDNVVELTIGSATILVNGEAQTMDVAPEISSDRTMLPARYVAEGLGYQVGWDPATQTVLLSK